MIKQTILDELNRNPLVQIVVTFFILMSVWWFSIYFRGLHDAEENNYFTLIYPLLSLTGAISGLVLARKWGGFKSYLGGALSFFSLGLLAQFFGQASYAYYIYVIGIEVPYPSFGDVGYFASVLFYIRAVYLLAKVSGLKNSIKTSTGKFLAFLVPVVLSIFSYFIFLQGYEYDFSNKIKIFLDFGYPFGEAIYLSIALLALFLCRSILGGIMKKPIMFFILALIFQYLCDFTFLYQSGRGIWYVGGINDYMYFVSYFLMIMALVYMNVVYRRVRES